MYKRPGVYVYQIYEDRTIPARDVEFAPAVVGACTPVVEGEMAYAGKIDYTSAGPRVTFTLPKFDPLFDEAVAIRIFLVPAGGTQSVRIESFTRDYLRRFGIKRDFVGPVADITAAVESYTWTDGSGAQRKGIEDISITIPTTITSGYTTYNGFRFAAGKPAYPICDVYVEYRATRKAISKTIVETFTGTGKTIFELSRAPVVDVRVFLESASGRADVTQSCQIDKRAGIVTYPNGLAQEQALRVEYTVANPIYSAPTVIKSVSEIVEKFGAPHPLNPIALGAYLALTSGGIVHAMAVETVAAGTHALDTQKLSSALAKVLTKDVYAFAVLDSAKRVAETVLSFLNASSAPEKGDFKIAMLGFAGEGDFANITSLMLKDELIRFAYPLNSPRLRILANLFVDVNVLGTIFPVAGFYYGAAYAGQVCAIMNDSPAKSLTNTAAPVAGARFTASGEKIFTEEDLDELASVGYWILVEERDGVYVRHQLTTAEKDYAQREDSVVRAADYFALTLKKVLKQLVGISAGRTFVNDTLVPIVNEQIRLAIAKGIAGENTSLVEVVREEPDTYRVTIEYEPIIPANIIKIVLVI